MCLVAVTITGCDNSALVTRRSSSSKPTATSSPADRPRAGSGVVGRATAGPTCPVERADKPCPPRPVTADIDVLDRKQHLVTTSHTDELGRYAIALRPGAYTLHVANTGTFPRCTDIAINVASVGPMHADINCDTGIR